MFRTFRKFTTASAIVGICVIALAVDATAQGFLLRFIDRVDSHGSDQWSQFVGAGFHRLEVEGDGDTDLDCFVTDRYGNHLGSDTDETDYCIVTWYQSTDKRISFRIDNLGNVYNRYEFRLR